MLLSDPETNQQNTILNVQVEASETFDVELTWSHSIYHVISHCVQVNNCIVTAFEN